MTQSNRVSTRRRELLIAASALTGAALAGRAGAQAKTKVVYGQGSIDPIFTARSSPAVMALRT